MHDVHVLVVQDAGMQALGSKSPREASSLKCEQCSKTFSRSWLLKNHQRVHTGERPYTCAFCSKCFADKSNLRQHQRIHTTTEKLFQCGICQRTFAQRRYLMKHATEIHRDVPMSLYGSSPSEQMVKEEEPIRFTREKPSVKTSAAVAVQANPEIPSKSADHQYLTRQKSRTKTTSESKEDTDTKDKKYSEQDLKDFIKSNQKTMEKNGYIFIKQNFESLDTEPTLTEMSEIPVTAVSDEMGLKTDTETGNQILNVNGKMVFLQMDKPILAPTLSQHSSVSSQNLSEPQVQGGNSNIFKGRKLIAKKDTVVRRHANILKGSISKKGQEAVVSGNAVKFVNIPSSTRQGVPKAAHLMPDVAQNSVSEPLTFVQMMPQSVLPLDTSQGPYVIPVTLVQNRMAHHGQPLLVSSNSSHLKTVALSGLGSTSVNNTVVNNSAILATTCNTAAPAHLTHQVFEIQTVPVAVNEKGATGNMTESQVVASTPIVSDAPWQGIVNINSEQELLEYINAQSLSTVEADQGMTIMIQNVDSQNAAVMSLDSQSLLSSSGTFSNVFSDHSAIIPDVLPVSNITKIQINSEDTSQDNTRNEREYEINISFPEETDNAENSRISIVKEEPANDSDDSQSQVMLTEANREHLSDTDDFTEESREHLSDTDDFTGETRVHLSNTDDFTEGTREHLSETDDFTDAQSDKMVVKSEHEAFSDHTMYTAHVIKCEIDEKVDELMETEDCDSDGMVIDIHCANHVVVASDADANKEV